MVLSFRFVPSRLSFNGSNIFGVHMCCSERHPVLLLLCEECRQDDNRERCGGGKTATSSEFKIGGKFNPFRCDLMMIALWTEEGCRATTTPHDGRSYCVSPGFSAAFESSSLPFVLSLSQELDGIIIPPIRHVSLAEVSWQQQPPRRCHWLRIRGIGVVDRNSSAGMRRSKSHPPKSDKTTPPHANNGPAKCARKRII